MSNILEQYKQVVGEEVIDQLCQLALPLKGMHILHVNSTALGGGVAEILAKMVPLMNALGIETRWEVIKGNEEFYQCTKNFHNALQGRPVHISPQALKVYEEINALNAQELKHSLEQADIVIIHDPQPAALISHYPQRKGKWIWRCHIDASSPFRAIWKYLRQYVEKFDATVFSLSDFVQELSHPIYLIPPSIDPLSEKNVDLSPEEINTVYGLFGIDPNRPMILQVSRFDPFKDPLGVISAYYMAKKYKPTLQLVLAGGYAVDDPEGAAVYQEVKSAAEGDPDIHVLLLPADSHRTINALQRAATVVLQKSTKEGFGLTVTEALWKGKPVIGGNCGGIRLQVINHHTGFLVNTPEGAAHRIRYLLQNPDKIEEMGKKGKEFVHNRFLITRHLQEYLTMILSLLSPQEERLELKRQLPDQGTIGP